MKKMIWIFLMLLSPVAFAQQNNGMTPEEQAQFRKQMDDFQKQMEDQMQSLKDSLRNMEQAMKDVDWSQFDSLGFEMPEMPEMPERAPMPPSNSVEVYGDDTKVRVGHWNIDVESDDSGDDHVHVYKDDPDGDECSDWYGDGHDLKNVETKFMLLDVGLNNYFGKGFSSSFPSGYESLEPNPGKSWVVNIHVINQRLNLIDYHLWLSYGVFFELNSYKYNNDNVLIPRIDSVAFQPSDDALKKNKLSCEYVGIPLMFRYESNPSHEDKSFHISAGGFGEYLLGAHTKVKNTSNDKAKQHDDFNLNRFRYGVTFRAGYGFVNLFANIGLSELFVSGAGPVLYPSSAGLAFEF